MEGASRFERPDRATRRGAPFKAAVAYAVDAPADPRGDWWIDLEIDGVKTNVAWKQGQGFGIYTSDAGYRLKPQERFDLVSEASARLLQLVADWRRDGRDDAPAQKVAQIGW